jgi:putative transposase
MIYHALNRANFRSRLFKREEHYQDFLDIVEESLRFVPMRILAYCLMPNHWHLVLYPRADGDLSKFLQRITLTHTQRYHSQTRTAGYGHVYQGRYKSLAVESDRHFLTLVRYVERNAKRAALVKKAEDWPWSSVYARVYGNEKQKKLLSPWPVAEPRHYLEWLNASQGKEEIENIRYAIKKSRPYGSEKWVANAVGKFGLENTMRNRGRPKKGT